MGKSVAWYLNEVARLRQRIELQYHHIATLEQLQEGGEDEASVTIGWPDSMRRAGYTAADPLPGFFAPSVLDDGDDLAEPLTPPPGFGNYAADTDDIRPLGILLLGVPDGEIERIVRMIERRVRRQPDIRPLFITDSTATAPFRHAGLMYEHLPTYDDGTCSPATRRRYIVARVRLLEEKWGLSGIINLGRVPLPLDSAADDEFVGLAEQWVQTDSPDQTSAAPKRTRTKQGNSRKKRSGRQKRGAGQAH
ncbi:MAG: hypothetical protein AAF637_22535 [Pseudomonadota bacterium]